MQLHLMMSTFAPSVCPDGALDLQAEKKFVTKHFVLLQFDQ